MNRLIWDYCPVWLLGHIQGITGYTLTKITEPNGTRYEWLKVELE